MEHGEIPNQSDILGRATKPCIKGPLGRCGLLCSITTTPYVIEAFQKEYHCNAILKSIKMRNHLTKLTLG